MDSLRLSTNRTSLLLPSSRGTNDRLSIASSLRSRFDQGMCFNKATIASRWKNIIGHSDIVKRSTGIIYAQHTEGSLLKEKDRPVLEVGSPMKFSPGKAFPLGASEVEDGINFAIFSQNASSVTLCFSSPERSNDEDLYSGMTEVALDPQKNKTGGIWHICVEGLPNSGVPYGYHIDGPHDWKQGHRFDRNIILLDPYAKLVVVRKSFGDVTKMSKFLGT